MDAGIVFLAGLIVFIVLVIILYRVSRNKAEGKATETLQKVLDPGEELIEFTRVNTKGPSAATVFFAGAIGSAIARAGGTELYAGLTPRRLILTPVKPGKDSQGMQVIPIDQIQGFKVVGGMQGSSTLTARVNSGDVVMYVSSKYRWLRKAVLIQKAFSSHSLTGG